MNHTIAIRRFRIRLGVAVSGAVALGIALAGCNAILDNREGTLAIEQSESGVDPLPDRVDSAPTSPVDGGTDADAETEDDDASADDAGLTCPAGQFVCFGSCVSASDPIFGCGNPSCAPCATPHAEAACQAGKCVVATCEPNYADCNMMANDGCETNLSTSASCGACGGACPASAPNCAPSGTTFQCTNGCPADAPKMCGADCVNTQKNVNHCGDCNKPCPMTPNGVAGCSGGSCTLTCQTGYHRCGDVCAPNTSPTQCGPSCQACPAPANGTASCVDNACAIACNPRFRDCNDNAADGCETNVWNNQQNCGACGNVCKLKKCKQGKCQGILPIDANATEIDEGL